MRCPNCGYRIDPKRTDKQQRTFHKLCSSYSRASGQGAAYVKILFKYLHGPWVTYPFRGPAPEWPGRFIEMFQGTPDHKLIYMKSEGAYTKKEERVLIDGAVAECFDIGADIEWLKEAI